MNINTEARKLTDAELEAISGGSGRWYDWAESAMKRTWTYRSTSGETDLDFEDWLKARETPDNLQARAAWIAAGKSENTVYCFDNGNTWTEYGK